ncbi:MAG: dephospho-CoA kinase, partial [Muribaculaceae bacterium]|nr:dephospho-CoA kinase [Muribaculaceae bacterium]
MIGHTHIVAITGGIGSGKSVVSRILRCMGYPVYDCDSEARRLMDGSAEILSRIAGEISPDAIGADGRLRRDVLSAMVFSDSSKLQCLNSIVHGAVRKHLLSTVASCGSPLFFFETAILYE